MNAFGGIGAQYTFWAFRNASGYAIGTDADLANGEDSGAGRLFGVEQMGLAIPQTRNVVGKGDNGVVYVKKLPGDSAAEGQLLTSLFSQAFATGAQGLLINTVGNTDFIVNGVPCPDHASLCIVQNSPAVDEDGEDCWEIMCYMNLEISPRGPVQVQDSTPHQYTHDISANRASKTPWGEALTLAKYGATKAYVVGPFKSDKPFALHSALGNGSMTTFTLDETPSGENANDVMLWEAGTLGTYSATPDAATKYKVVASTKTITVGATGQEVAAGVPIEVLYKFLPQC